MAGYSDIQKHFSGLRVQTARRKGRPDPFATGFEDDSDDDFRKSRPKTKAPVQAKPSPITPRAPAPVTAAKSPSAISRPKTDDDDDDDNFLLEVGQKKAERRSSPAPVLNSIAAAQRVTDGAGRRGSLPGVLSDQKKAAISAAGPLAYLDDSDEEDNISRPSRRTIRSQSPAPRKTSDLDPHARASTPSGPRLSVTQPSPDKSIIPPRHTVASPFAGTKYLQDSDSDSDEEAVASRKGSAEEIAPIVENKRHHEVQRVDKGRLQNGGGVSWRAFSAGRAEQRNAELETLAANFRKRGRSIQFCPTVRTDDGRQISLAPTIERNGPLLGRRPGQNRAKSPPRRAADTKPGEEDEMADREPGGSGGPVRAYDPTVWKTNPFSGEPIRRTSNEHRSSIDSDIKRPYSPNDSIPDIRIDDISQP
ncbi:hypothetical protein Slin15195_G056880 [Septoria linicola]|uniref:Uncharacterized protein n=1 Tax=Septoria linicola TaxID=215465 RepID=A0A9Q9AN56_9PEZI|nr:hypothetical protein Slin14017_G072750 [Septoria linicola]USW52369.1 hypothetical protein Slin15195_G056880 [Septoria linicola]